MTTQRTHSCNLCRGYVTEGTGVGIRFGSMDAIELTTPGQAETHLCQKCIDGLEIALEELRRQQCMRDELAAAQS